MPQASDGDKLAIRLSHWMKHNDVHAREFREWSQKASSLGHGAVSDDITRAAEQLSKANEFLLAATEKLKGE